MPAAPIVTRYPLDPTGVSTNNKVEGEPHTLSARPIRAIAPLYGAFFTESIVVKEVATGNTLVKNTDYYCSELYQVPSANYGKEICSIILIINSNIQPDITIDYQALGGPWSYSQQAIVQMLDNLNIDDRPVTWDDIINKPEAFAPLPHLHDAGDVYGFEYVVAGLERLRQAILLGDSVSHDLIYAYIDQQIANLKQYTDDQIAQLKAYVDSNFVKNNVTVEGSIRVLAGGIAEVFASSQWRQFWPPLWQ